MHTYLQNTFNLFVLIYLLTGICDCPTLKLQMMSQANCQEKLHLVVNSILEEKFVHATDVKIKPISSDGVNYTSSLFEVTIVTPEEIFGMFAKVLTMGDKFDALSKDVFIVEEFVYSMLSGAYERLQSLHGIVDRRFVFPKCYKTSNTDGEGTIILENLVSKGYNCQDRFKCMDWKYASKCVETLAKFHALSFALRMEYPEEFKLAGDTLKLRPLTGPEWNHLADGALAAVNETDRDKLSQLLEGSVGFSKVNEFIDPCETSVIIHGDYRPSNLMHKEVNGELHVIPVDYQITRLGCPVADLIYFIVLGSDQQFRRQHFHQLVDHYYQQLALAMTSLGLVPEELYGREEFERDMKKKLPLGLCVAAVLLPFVTMEPAHALSFEHGRFVPRANGLLAERFRGLIDDFKMWGFI